MDDWRARIDEMLAELQQERDELRLKMHLGQQDLRDEMDRLDSRLDELRQSTSEWAGKAEHQLADVAADAGQKTRHWLAELKQGFQKARDRINRDEQPGA